MITPTMYKSHLAEKIQRFDVVLEIIAENKVCKGLGCARPEMLLQLHEKLLTRGHKVPLQNLDHCQYQFNRHGNKWLYLERLFIANARSFAFVGFKRSVIGCGLWGKLEHRFSCGWCSCLGLGGFICRL